MAALRDSRRPLLVCPECVGEYPGHARIGNRKGHCRTCNRFSQAVRREVAKNLAVMHPRDAADLRVLAEADVYERLGLSGSTEEEGTV